EKGGIYEGLRAIANDREKLAAHPSILNNPDIQNLKAALTAAQTDKAQAAAKGSGAKQLEADGYDARIQTAQQKLDKAEDNVVEAARNEAEIAKARQASFQQTYDQQNQAALNLNRTGTQYTMLVQEEQSNKLLFDQLLSKTKETDVSG